MQPEYGKKPLFSQIYIYDQQNELQNGLNSFEQLDKDILNQLQDMLKNVNPYAQKYQQVAEALKEKPTEDIRLVLKTTERTIDPQRYNVPTGTDVAVIILTEGQQTVTHRDIVVYKSAAHHPDGKYLMRIDETHPMYDPLMYVLMFPFGDKGWERIDKNNVSGNKRYTPMQYYRY